ncbi:unnamed protein product [Heterobilharzia americana]|nr:unnamed protein product [Heterobilharzia americana]
MSDAVVSASALSASDGIPSGPAAFPHFSSFMALRTSTFVGGFMFTCSSVAAGGISGRSAAGVGGRFKSLLKWSAHRFLCFSSLVIRFPSSSFIGFVCVDLFPDSILVIWYNVIRSLLPAACSASVGSVS